MSQGSDQSPDAHLSTVLKDNYRIDELLGRGGMGAVYRATHLRLGSKVAVKLLLSGVARNHEAQHRFRREAKVAMDLSDENIVHIHDYDVTADGTPFIVMEYLEGEDLADMLQREAPLHLDRVVELARQIGSALSAAHGQGVIHRDLKPENIFLKRRANGEEVVKVVDFGIAKVLDSKSVVTRTGALLGTPLFMAPEQARQEPGIDGRADIFSFGCILYYMLSGRLPFHGDKYAQVLLQIISRDPSPLRSLVPRLLQEVEQVVHRALAKDPAERFQSVDLMMHALSKAAGVSWGTALEYVETVVTGTPAALAAEANSEFGFAETMPPDAPSLLDITGPGLDLPRTLPGCDAGTVGLPAAMDPGVGTAPTVPPTLPPKPLPPPAQPPISEFVETPLVAVVAPPARGRRFPVMLLAVVLILAAGGASAWLLRGRFVLAGDETPKTPTEPAELAEQKWSKQDEKPHAPAPTEPDATPKTTAAVPTDAAVSARALAPDAARTVTRRRPRRPPRKPRQATLRIKVLAGGLPVRARIFINGRHVGESPHMERLAPGKHMVRISRQGFTPVDRPVVLKAGKMKLMTVKLD